MLRGPEHPENFRQQVGRYGDRHYVDNLPGDALYSNTGPHTPYPSVSVIKQAWPKFLSDWAAGAAARYAVDHQPAWSQLPADDAVELITKAAVRTRDRAAKRGSDVHGIIEQLALGHKPDYLLIDDAVQPYVPCLERMVRDLRIRPVVSEAVVFNHRLGYGGTFDMIADTVHGRALLDWKTRAKTSRYDEEAAQVAAYAGGEYMIVQQDGAAVRVPIPDIDRLLVVVLTPEGYAVHEVNEVDAWDLWTSLHAFWRTKTDTKVWEGTLATPGPAHPLITKQNLVERVQALSPGARAYLAANWPSGLPTLKQNPSDYDLIRIDDLLIPVEIKDSAPFNVVRIDEGEQLDIGTFRHIDAVYKTLDDDMKAAVDWFLAASKPSVAMGQFTRTVRRFEILRMLIYVAEYCKADVTAMTAIIDASALGQMQKEEAERIANEYSEKLQSESVS